MAPRVRLVSESVHEMGRPTIVGILRDLGAQGIDIVSAGADPTGGSDSTGAIQAAITEAAAMSPRGAVILPMGLFKTTGNFDLTGKSGLTFMGSGVGSTTIEMTHATNDLFKYGTATGNLSDITISDFSVTATSAATRTGGWVLRGHGAAAASSFLVRSRIERIDIKKQVNGLWLNQFEFVFVSDVTMTNFVGSGGIALKAGQTSAAGNQGSELRIGRLVVDGRDFVGADPVTLATGIWIEDCDAVYVSSGSCVSEVLTNNVRMVAGASGLHNHFFDQFVSDTTRDSHGVYVTGTGVATELKFTGCWFASAGRASGGSTGANGVRLDATTLGRVEMTGCNFFNNKGTGLFIVSPNGCFMPLSGCNFTENGSGAVGGNNNSMSVDIGLNTIGPTIVGNGFNGVSVGGNKDLVTSATSNKMVIVGNRFVSARTMGIAADVDANNA